MRYKNKIIKIFVNNKIYWIIFIDARVPGQYNAGENIHSLTN
jgi:hypothetical protein